MPGRNSWYTYRLNGPIMVARNGNLATVKWVIDSSTRFDDCMSIKVRLGVSAVFSQTSHFDITADSTWFKHNDRKRQHDPVREVNRIPNSLDLEYFEEVEYHSIWHYNRGEFDTTIRVSGTLMVPENERLTSLTAMQEPGYQLEAYDVARMTNISTLR